MFLFPQYNLDCSKLFWLFLFFFFISGLSLVTYFLNIPTMNCRYFYLARQSVVRQRNLDGPMFSEGFVAGTTLNLPGFTGDTPQSIWVCSHWALPTLLWDPAWRIAETESGRRKNRQQNKDLELVGVEKSSAGGRRWLFVATGLEKHQKKKLKNIIMFEQFTLLHSVFFLFYFILKRYLLQSL